MSENAVRDAAMFRAAFDSLPDPVMIHDESTILYVNPPALKVLRASRADQVVGRDFREFVHPDGRSAGEGRRAVLADSGHPIPPLPVKLIAVDGATVYVEARGGWRIDFDGTSATLVVARRP